MTLPEVHPEISAATLTERSVKNISFELLYDKKVLFDTALAHKFINMTTFAGERPLRDRHVEFLVGEAKRGTFLYDMASLVSCDCNYDGVERRLNGQHTAWMRTYLTGKFEDKIRVVKFAVETEEDFRKLYCAIDRGAPRTPAHVIQARLFGTEEFEGISMETIGLLQKGFRLLNTTAHEGKFSMQTNMLADKLLGESRAIALLVANLIEALEINKKQVSNKHMRRGPVCAAMFMTLAKARGESTEFWTMITTGLFTGLTSKTDARYKLREYLLRSDLSSEHSAKRKRATAEEMLRVCIAAWNHHRSGTPVHVLVTTKTRQAAK